jgi:hypothetical protein
MARCHSDSWSAEITAINQNEQTHFATVDEFLKFADTLVQQADKAFATVSKASAKNGGRLPCTFC